MRKLLALAVLLLAGCSSATHELGPEWRPLETIRERPALLRNAGSPTAITTVGKHAYVRDLDEWLGRVPPGSAKYKGIVRHEQEHSIRQLDRGVFLWITQYSYDADFALEEEQIGFFWEMTTRRANGEFVSAENYARVLNGYKTIVGGRRLISYADALTWARDVLAGRWTPPN